MALFHRLGTWLLVVSLVSLCLPRSARAADFDKYLLDDTDALLTLNVKQVVDAPLFAKHFRKQAETLLQMETIQKTLRDSGVDVFKDVERVTVVLAASSHRVEQRNNSTSSSSGLFVIVQGRFDPAKLEAAATKLLKDNPEWLKSEKVGGVNLYRLAEPQNEHSRPTFAALVDRSTVIIAQHEDQVRDAIDKAAGKTKTQLKHKALQELLPKLDTRAAASWLAIGEMINGTSVNSMSVNGMTVTTVKHSTLKEEGIEAVTGTLNVSDDFKGETTLTLKDADKAKETAETIEQGVKKATQFLEGAASQEKKITALVDVLKGLKVASKEKTVSLQAQGGADAVEAWVMMMFLRR
jgi:hypothetical protein